MTQHIQNVARIVGCGLLFAASIAGAGAQTVDPSPAQTTTASSGPDQARDAAVPRGAAVARPLAAPHPRDTLTRDWGGNARSAFGRPDHRWQSRPCRVGSIRLPH